MDVVHEGGGGVGDSPQQREFRGELGGMTKQEAKFAHGPNPTYL